MPDNREPGASSAEPRLKHLEFIQNVIVRMGSNSFRLKGWSVVLVSALLVLISRACQTSATYIALLPVLVFWGLDAYFLSQERRYRALYDQVRVLNAVDIDFSMATGHLSGPKLRWRSAAASRTLLPFYLALAVAVSAAMFFVQP